MSESCEVLGPRGGLRSRDICKGVVKDWGQE